MYIGRPAYIEGLNDISFWYPILKRINMATPATQLFFTDNVIGKIVDGEVTKEFRRLKKAVYRAQADFGGEAFLRTGQTSAKHEWVDTCHLTEKSNVGRHIAALIEFSMMADLPYTTFAVREMIETVAITVAFRQMPIVRELRVFAEKGNLICAHPYWPAEAFREDEITNDQLAQLHDIPDLKELTQMAQYTSKYFDRAWSMDFLQDSRGDWWLTDMALASSSYHWQGCKNEGVSKE